MTFEQIIAALELVKGAEQSKITVDSPNSTLPDLSYRI